MDGSQNILDFEADSLIDMNQLSENLVDVDPYSYELPGIVKAEKEADNSLVVDVNNRLPKLHESTEPEPCKKGGKYNLRKSLAWDSAFFTSAGVLDQEELINMMTGPDKAKKNVLPRIEEDITGSTESMSSLQSDNLTLESLEGDLFVDIRASIQRSSKKKSNLMNSSGKAIAAEVDSGAISAMSKEELASQNKNLIPASKRTNGLQPVRTSKRQSNNLGKPVSGKVLKQGLVPSQVTQSTAKIDHSNSVLPRPPKATSKPTIPTSMAPAKRDSTGTATVSRKGILPPKASTGSCAGKPLPKPAILSKSSSLRSSTTSRVQSTRSSTSTDSSSSISSKTIPAKSPSVPARRNPMKNANLGKAPSGSFQKTPSKAAPNNRLPSSKMPTKNCSSVSPASSISDWSSVSSSSSLVNPRLNSSRTSLDASSCTSLDHDAIPSDLKNQSTDPNVDGNQRIPGNRSKKSSTQTGTLQTLAKPSGLRLPSPKIGFFDGVKSSARTPQKSQSGLCTMLPKGGAAVGDPSRNSNIKLSSSKVPTATPLANTSPKYTSLTSLNKASHALGNASPKDNATGYCFQKIGEVQVVDGVDQLGETAMGAFINENLDDLHKETDLSMHKNVNIVVMKTATTEGSIGSASKHADQRGDRDLETSPNPICILDVKEKGPVLYQGEMVKGHDRDVNPTCSGQMNEVLSEILDSATASMSSLHIASSALKNVWHHDDCMSLSKESVIQVKSSARTPSGHQRSQSGLDTILPKRGAAVCTPSRNSNIKSKSSNVQTATPLAKIKPISPKYTSPSSLHKESHASGNVSPNLALEANDNATGHYCQNVGTLLVVDGVDRLDDLNKETDLSMHKNVDIGLMKNTTTEGNNDSGSKHADQRGDEDHKSIPSPICIVDDKEVAPVIYNGDVVKGYDRDVNPTFTGPMEEVLSEILDSATASMSSLHIAPLALQNISDNDDCISLSKESVVQVKSSARMPCGPQRSQSGLCTMLPNNGAAVCTPSRNSNIKPMSSTVQTATPSAKIKPGSPKYTSPTHASGNDSPILVLEAKDDATRYYCQNIGKVQVADGVDQLDELNQETDLSMHKNVDIRVMKNATTEGNNGSGSKHAGQREDEDLENASNPICTVNDKENGPVIYQGDVVERHDRDVNPTFSGPMDEVLSEVLDSVPASMSSLHIASPFALENVCDNDDCRSFSEESAIQVKSSACTSNGPQKSQSGLNTMLPKSGAAAVVSPRRNSNIKPKSSEVPSATPLANIKHSSPKPTSLHKESHAIGNDSPPILAFEASSATEHYCQKIGEVEVVDSVDELRDACIAAIIHKKFDDLNEETYSNMHKNVDIGVVKNKNGSGSKHAGGQKGNGDIKSSPNPICIVDDKENGPVIYQGSVVRRHDRDADASFSRPMDEVLSVILDSNSSPQRFPFAQKKVCENDDCVSLSKESAIQIRDETTFALPSFEMKE